MVINTNTKRTKHGNKQSRDVSSTKLNISHTRNWKNRGFTESLFSSISDYPNGCNVRRRVTFGTVNVEMLKCWGAYSVEYTSSKLVDKLVDPLSCQVFTSENHSIIQLQWTRKNCKIKRMSSTCGPGYLMPRSIADLAPKKGQ